MSSLKGQLSNVEGSVKSMKVAVVVGSVLTVACLAAVFGVTVLANEVSKEVKVSNGALAAKSGEMVKTASVFPTEDMTPTPTDETITLVSEEGTLTAKIQASITSAEEYIYILDGAIFKINQATKDQNLSIQEGSLLASAISGEVEARQPKAILSGIALCALNPVCASLAVTAAKVVAGAVVTTIVAAGIVEATK